jgi:uncharacterized membrane protein
LRWGFGLGALATAGLVVFGVLTTPGFFDGGSAWAGPVAAISIVLAYGLAGVFGLAPGRRSAAALEWAVPLGLLGGAVYASETVLEYAVRPTDNTAGD